MNTRCYFAPEGVPTGMKSKPMRSKKAAKKSDDIDLNGAETLVITSVTEKAAKTLEYYDQLDVVVRGGWGEGEHRLEVAAATPPALPAPPHPSALQLLRCRQQVHTALCFAHSFTASQGIECCRTGPVPLQVFFMLLAFFNFAMCELTFHLGRPLDHMPMVTSIACLFGSLWMLLKVQ